MGCGESKQAVATENTLAKSKSKNLENNPPIEKPANDVAGHVETNVKENGKKIIDADKKESEGGSENSPSNKKDDKETNVKESGVDENVVVVEENINKNNDDDNDNEELLKGGAKEKQLLVSDESPKEKDDHEVETIESIISEGIPGKSDYYSPRAKGHAEKDAEAKLDKEKVTEEVLKVDEGKAVATPTDETKSSGEGEENISATVKNETANAASTN
ncbi:hypothetical protein OROMI_005893 [Orobanche minor]